MAVSDQIRQVMEGAGLTVEEFALRLNEKPQRVKDVLRGKQRAPEDLLVKLVEIFQADANWLLTGRWMTHQVNQNVASYGIVLNAPDEIKHIENYRASPEEKRKILREVGSAFAQCEQSKQCKGGK